MRSGLGAHPLWVLAILFLWVSAVRFAASRSNDGRRVTVNQFGAIFLLAVVPPTTICGITTYVLYNAAPTVQFNVGSANAMALWSFWVHSFGYFLLGSLFLSVAYVVWGIQGIWRERRPGMNATAVSASVAALLGLIVIAAAFPSA